MIGQDEGGKPKRNSDERIEEMDKLLRSIRFEPRSSLGPELWGALPGGGAYSAHPSTSPWLVAAFLAATLLLGAVIAGLWQKVVPNLRISVVDHCCFDFDGGGESDDGIIVTTRAGSKVRQLTIYEDRDHSHSFTAADTVRYTRGKDPIMTPLLASGLGVKKLCCLDYDGGGKSDDGLLIIGQAPDQIAAAAIFENDGQALPVLR